MSLQVPNETDASSGENPVGGDEFCVMHLMVIGFHPRSGYRVEYCTPPLRQVGENGTTEEVSENVSRDIQLPEEWECIRYLALPDGAHNHDRDTIYFSMPSRKSSQCKSTVFGVSCYRQISVKHRVGDGARGSIQKSVCILANMPLYSLLESKLRFVTEAFFDQIELNLPENQTNATSSQQYQSQSPENMLEICFDHIKLMLGHSSSPGMRPKEIVPSPNNGEGEVANGKKDENLASSEATMASKDHLLFEQLPLPNLIAQLGCSKFLVLFKLILMEPRIVFYGPRVLPIGQLMLSLCSLFPMMLLKGLANSHCREQVDDSSKSSPQPDSSSVQLSESANGVSNSESSTNLKLDEEEETFEIVRKNAIGSQERPKEKHAATFFDPLTQTDSIAASNKTNNVLPEECVPDVPESNPEDEFLPMIVNFAAKGFPLRVYDGGNLWIPYASLHQLSELQTCKKAFSVGCTNALFISNYGGLPCDVVVHVDEKEISFDWKNHELKKLTHLSSEDIRFGNELTLAAQSLCKSQGIDWHGGEQHLRLNFNLYLSSLLLSILSQDHKQISCFYGPFCRAYERTENFQKWKESLSPDQKVESLVSLDALLHPGSLQGSRMDAVMNVMWDDMSMRWNHMTSVSQKYSKVKGAKSAVSHAARSAFGNLFRVSGTTKTNQTKSGADSEKSCSTVNT